MSLHMKSNLDFCEAVMPGRLFDTEIGRRLYRQLLVRISLQTWGDESYGTIGVDLGEESPVPDIPPGGIAYTSQGAYLCFFYGQRPAWPVEHVGEILNGEWNQLRSLKLQGVYITGSGD